MKYGLWRPIPQYVQGVRKWSTGRGGTPIQAVIIHRVEGRLEGADSWLRNPASGPASTHFGIGFPSYLDRLLRRNVQTWQWVDTIHAAYGWAHTPTDYPTAVGRKVLGHYLKRKATWPYWQSVIDLNRPVIAIEVEGFADKPFDPLFIPPLKALLNALVKAHGPLWVLTHTDMSAKPCPGLNHLIRAVPGYYGELLGSTALPDTAVEDEMYGWVARMKPQKPKVMQILGGRTLYRAPGEEPYGKTPTRGAYVTLIGDLYEMNTAFWVFPSANGGLGLVRKADVGKIGPALW